MKHRGHGEKQRKAEDQSKKEEKSEREKMKHAMKTKQAMSSSLNATKCLKRVSLFHFSTFSTNS